MFNVHLIDSIRSDRIERFYFFSTYPTIRYCDTKSESETFNVRYVVVVIVATTEWRKCSFGIFAQEVNIAVSNMVSERCECVTILHILHILYSAEIISLQSRDRKGVEQVQLWLKLYIISWLPQITR